MLFLSFRNPTLTPVGSVGVCVFYGLRCFVPFKCWPGTESNPGTARTWCSKQKTHGQCERTGNGEQRCDCFCGVWCVCTVTSRQRDGTFTGPDRTLGTRRDFLFVHDHCFCRGWCWCWCCSGNVCCDGRIGVAFDVSPDCRINAEHTTRFSPAGL